MNKILPYRSSILMHQDQKQTGTSKQNKKCSEGGILNEFFFQIIIICNTQKRERTFIISFYHYYFILLLGRREGKMVLYSRGSEHARIVQSGGKCFHRQSPPFVVASACISSCSSFTRIKRKLTERSLDNELRERERGSTHKSNYEPHKRCRRRGKRPK